jgi:hypothetical protein
MKIKIKVWYLRNKYLPKYFIDFNKFMCNWMPIISGKYIFCIRYRKEIDKITY